MSQKGNTCVICGIMHATNQVDQHHIIYHHKLLAACLQLGYYPDPAELREKRKKRGHKLVNDSGELNDRVYGALQVIRAWFDRSLAMAIQNEYWSEHPSFEDYAGMIGDHFPEEVQVVIQRRFGCMQGQLDGSNYWKPPGDSSQ